MLESICLPLVFIGKNYVKKTPNNAKKKKKVMSNDQNYCVTNIHIE